jgi:hypothetical protein
MTILRRHGPFHLTSALLLALAVPPVASAQTVVGRVVDQETLQPIAGAFVTLETPDGKRHRGVLTRPDGRYILRADAPGAYRLTAQMIGYASPPAQMVDLVAGGTLERVIEVPVQAITLDGISVSSAARCRPRPGSGRETARLWDEAKKALEVALWTERSSTIRFQGVRHERRLDPGTLRVLANSEAGWTGWSSRSPYESLPVEQLSRDGYVQRESDGTLTFYGPDADVLLSDLFLDSHCFYVREGTGAETHLVGLAFEPVRRGRIPDIKGVLWLDRGSAELRRLDFSYTDVPELDPRAWDVAQGRVEFERLATGVWIVRRWHIRMPVAEARDVLGRRTVVVTSVQEEGAEVRHVIGSDGRPLAEAGGATLFGVVTDSATGGPVAGALVDVVAMGRTAVTGEDGTFRISELGAGLFDVEVTRRDGDPRGVEPVQRVVELEGGRAARLAVAVPAPRPQPAEPAIPARAPAADGQERAVRNALLGVVVEEDTREPVRGALVRVLGSDGSPAGSAVTDAHGRFRIHHPDRGSSYTLRVEHLAYSPSEGAVRFDRDDQLRVEVALSTRAIELEGITVTERRRGALADAGFYDRMAHGMGVFVEVDEMHRQRASRAGDYLMGQRMIRTVSPRPYVEDVRIAGTERISESGFRDCQPAIYMDGALVRRAGEPRDEDLVFNDIVSASHIAGIEVFRRSTEVPPRYSGAGAACGVILVWTR